MRSVLLLTHVGDRFLFSKRRDYRDEGTADFQFWSSQSKALPGGVGTLVNAYARLHKA